MKFLGVDPGDARIGLSVSDELGQLARPLHILRHTSRAENARAICAAALEEGCQAIVVGVPYDSDGSVGPRARSSLKLIDALRQLADIQIIPWDESGSSHALDESLIHLAVPRKKRGEPRDHLVAALILQDYLDHSSQSEGLNQ